jgi:alpha-ketoglutarate-dependent taurine dioxygenase
VLILAGFLPLRDMELPRFCERLGTLQVFEFGVVHELRAREDSPTFIFSTAAVPFHWDGIFLGASPSWQFFSCEEAPPPGGGGETLFCDTIRLLSEVPPAIRRVWENVSVTYHTEKLSYYGGSVTFPLIGRHPKTGETTLRFHEPVETDRNPVWIELEGVAPADQPKFLADLRRRLYDPAVCLAHAWQPGDVLIADNHALLHGRRAYLDPSRRHLRRVNII